MRSVLRHAILGFALATFAASTTGVLFEPAGKGVKATTEGVSSDGKPTSTEYTANWDGKDTPLKGSAIADTTSLRRIDANTTERTDKKDGKVVQTLTRAVAKDGKSFTVAVKGKNAKGEPVPLNAWQRAAQDAALPHVRLVSKITPSELAELGE